MKNNNIITATIAKFVTSTQAQQAQFIAGYAGTLATRQEKMAFATCLFGHTRFATTNTLKAISELAAKCEIRRPFEAMALQIIGITEEEVSEYLA